MSNGLGYTPAKYDSSSNNKESRLGLVIGGAFGAVGLALVALTTPFILPALRKHCLPYVPATDKQLANLTEAFKKHAKLGDRFIDIGSGDGRICRQAARLSIFSEVHGVELNYPLIIFSRLSSLTQSLPTRVKYYHKDLWKFPLKDYDSICIFGVETMMEPLERYLSSNSKRNQTIFACRFPFKSLNNCDTIGSGIDTVWIYRISDINPSDTSRALREQ